MAELKNFEKKWQERWEKSKVFKTIKDDRPKFYCLEMFPYPSGSGLHMGHAFNYTIGDIKTRFKRMKGYNVLYPMGYDSFGLPAENAAIKNNSHPTVFTDVAIKNFISQQKSLGLSYDWDRMVSTCSPEYYKWNQVLFLKLYENGLVYRKKSPVNWCNKCNTVLANEQVHNGACWRHADTQVQKKELEQWFIRTSKYAQELLDDLEKIDWPENIKIMQRNWIGRSEGVTLDFDVFESENADDKKSIDKISTFTTRVDTVYGITYLVLAAEHPKVTEWTKGTGYESAVKEFILKVQGMSTIERTAEGKEKNGMFIGKYFKNPFTGEKHPIWIADYALLEYGTGAVMAVPAHDSRDFKFAKKYNLPIKEVIITKGSSNTQGDNLTGAFVSKDGIMINSNDFDGMSSLDAKEKIANLAEEKNVGKRNINFRLKDWLVSRQRFWGTPIPMIHCDKCGIVPAKIPVILPDEFKSGEGNPLENDEKFVNVKCTKCGGNARRETDTMDTFFDSSWYYLRYCDADNLEVPFSKDVVNHFMPVDQYIGGAEHACMHLIYARFFTKALRDIGMLDFDEPFLKLFNQGMLHGPDGHVMSKSRGNVVLPETVSEKYGIDTARFFLTSIALPDKDLEWSDSGIEGSLRFLNKVTDYFRSVKLGNTSPKVESKINKAIKGVEYDIENFRYNLAIIKIRAMFDALEEEVSQDVLEKFLKIIHPFCPHITEELWEGLGHSDFISLSSWPEYDESKIDEKAEILDEAVKETRKDIAKIQEMLKLSKISKLTLIISPEWKFRFYQGLAELLEETRNPKDIISAVMQTEMKKYSKDVMKIIPLVLKDPSKMPKVVLDQGTESRAYAEFAREFAHGENVVVEVVLAEEANSPKAGNAGPLKPAIVLE